MCAMYCVFFVVLLYCLTPFLPISITLTLSLNAEAHKKCINSPADVLGISQIYIQVVTPALPHSLSPSPSPCPLRHMQNFRVSMRCSFSCATIGKNSCQMPTVRVHVCVVFLVLVRPQRVKLKADKVSFGQVLPRKPQAI